MQLQDERETHFGTAAQAGRLPSGWGWVGRASWKGWMGEGEIRQEREGVFDRKGRGRGEERRKC